MPFQRSSKADWGAMTGASDMAAGVGRLGVKREEEGVSEDEFFFFICSAPAAGSLGRMGEEEKKLAAPQLSTFRAFFSSLNTTDA